MASLFLACAILGGIVVVLQFALALFGHDGDHEFGHDAADGFQLLSVRSLAATVAFFGIAGRAMLAAGTGIGVSTAVAAAVGALAGVLVALAMRALRGMETTAPCASPAPWDCPLAYTFPFPPTTAAPAR